MAVPGQVVVAEHPEHGAVAELSFEVANLIMRGHLDGEVY